MNMALAPARVSMSSNSSDAAPSHGRAVLTAEQIAAFRGEVLTHYQSTPRPMPWRSTTDPYAILVSEVMLQQTQVERVRLKYAEFLTQFPDVYSLAAASLAEVLLVWQGLGYNRRALFLKKCCEEVVAAYNGVFPRTPAELQKLPGIGHYTARAVAAFAYGIAEPLIETNIRTVYLHCFYPGRTEVSDKELMPLIAATLDAADPRTWYYALMDYGVMLKQTMPNPGRRSRHHVRQSRFEGSNRQLRSRLLRAVLNQPGVTVAELLHGSKSTGEKVVENLKALCTEGFLEVRDGGFQVRAET